MKKYLQLNDIDAYKIAFELSNYVWGIVIKWDYFAKDTIGKQFVKSIDSISDNIAEGFGRYTKKDKIRFYRYGFGSMYEALSQNQKAKVRKYQTTKEDISEVLKGFQRNDHSPASAGYEIIKVMGWDYQELCETYQKAVKISREKHIPVLIHVDEMTQPQGHSTSGSHERYKSKERLQWENDWDCIKKMREWIVESAIATEKELDKIRVDAKKHVREAQKEAWSALIQPIRDEVVEVSALFDEIAAQSTNAGFINKIKGDLSTTLDPGRADVISSVKKVLRLIRDESTPARQKLIEWLNESKTANHDRYNTYLYSHSPKTALLVEGVKPTFGQNAAMVDGRVVLRDNFDTILSNRPEVLIFGEDSGKIGGVNQGLEGLQEKYGELRVFDTGIREATILGQAIGMALRGLRPIAEIQYLDYLIYAIQTMSDDLATLQYRTRGGQKAPVIIRTRGHRLEGIWHAGSPMGMIINAVRGIYVCVPRDMTQAAGFYNTLLASDDPGLIIESLNGYRLKEKMPANLGELKVPLGVPEILSEGTDVTLVTYGSLCRMAEEAARALAEVEISVEVIDVQTLLPFDIHNTIVESLKKTNRIVFLDEDVPGGASAYMMQKVLVEQGGYYYLDSKPVTLTSKEHRPAYGSDGDYFSKPNIEDIFDAVYELMHESDPAKYPNLY